jgi:nucleotide-binding universal stress UspA family protein
VAGVVVGVGRASSSGPAVRWASSEAAVRGTSLTLVHAWTQPLDLSVDLTPDSLPDLVGAATSCAHQGAPLAVLLAHRPELLVFGGQSEAVHVPRLTRACLRYARCPVIVVPKSERPPTRRVVVGIGGTQGSGTVLQWAAQEARLRGADLVVAQAWQLIPRSAGDLLHPTRAALAQNVARLDRLSTWVHAALGTAAVEVLVPRGGPLDGLLDLAAEADLMVVGHRAHVGIGRLLLGVLSEDLSGLAPCPVAVIPDLRTPVTALT